MAAGDIQVALERVLTPRLTSRLDRYQPGHCARIVDAETPLAVRLCERVRAAARNDAQVLVLGAPPEVPAEVAVTSTKLVELRNPDADGRQRPPLLVFVPPGTHASAEDSFGVATFEEVALGDVYGELADRLLAELPAELRRGVAEILETVDEAKWPYATSYARARFLLTIQVNDNDPEVVGAALFELGLVPDLELYTDPRPAPHPDRAQHSADGDPEHTRPSPPAAGAGAWPHRPRHSAPGSPPSSRTSRSTTHANGPAASS